MRLLILCGLVTLIGCNSSTEEPSIQPAEEPGSPVGATSDSTPTERGEPATKDDLIGKWKAIRKSLVGDVHVTLEYRKDGTFNEVNETDSTYEDDEGTWEWADDSGGWWQVTENTLSEPLLPDDEPVPVSQTIALKMLDKDTLVTKLNGDKFKRVK